MSQEERERERDQLSASSVLWQVQSLTSPTCSIIHLIYEVIWSMRSSNLWGHLIYEVNAASSDLLSQCFSSFAVQCCFIWSMRSSTLLHLIYDVINAASSDLWGHLIYEVIWSMRSMIHLIYEVNASSDLRSQCFSCFAVQCSGKEAAKIKPHFNLLILDPAWKN